MLKPKEFNMKTKSFEKITIFRPFKTRQQHSTICFLCILTLGMRDLITSSQSQSGLFYAKAHLLVREITCESEKE